MKKRMIKQKSGQMKISFGMIFSIILIIAFIAFAIYAISIFLGVSDEVKIAKFVDDLQNDIDKRWQSEHSSQQISYNLPSKIEKVCFVNRVDENLIFLPIGLTTSDHKIEYLDIGKTLDGARELCFDNNKGIIMVLKKDFGEELVYIRKS